MNGKVIFVLAIGAAAVAGYFLYRESTAASGDASGDSGAGDSSGGDPSGAAAGSDSSTLEGVTDWAAGLAQQAGIGVTKGLRNHNPGNLRYVASIAWTGQIGDDGTGYAVFDSDEHGVRALGHQLQTYLNRGVNTVYSIISTYAPSSENDTVAYVSDVAQRLGVDPNQDLDASAIPQLAAAIIHHENGVQPFSLDDIQTWVFES